MVVLSVCALLVWAGIAVLPWQPYRIRERVEAADWPVDLSEVTVLIPARDEAEHIEHTLAALTRQGPKLDVVVVDDSSTDATADICERVRDSLGAPRSDGSSEFSLHLTLLQGSKLPVGWGGKLWALQQGLSRANRSYTLLLDADI